MKEHISMDEYFAGAGLMVMIKEAEKKRDVLCESLMDLLDDPVENTCVWDYVFEDDPPIKIWEELLKDKKIKVGGFEHAKNKVQ